MNYFVYILYSEQLDRFYIGSTQDIAKRLKKHLSNHKGYTARVKDWEVVYSESFETRTAVLKREHQIKGWKSKKMIQKLIESS